MNEFERGYEKGKTDYRGKLLALMDNVEEKDQNWEALRKHIIEDPLIDINVECSKCRFDFPIEGAVFKERESTRRRKEDSA